MTQQTFKTTQVLALEVNDAPNQPYRNLLPNPHGRSRTTAAGSIAGWSAPEPGTALITGQNGPLRIVKPTTGGGTVLSDPVKVKPGCYYSTSLTVTGTGLGAVMLLHWLDVTGTLIATVWADLVTGIGTRYGARNESPPPGAVTARFGVIFTTQSNAGFTQATLAETDVPLGTGEVANYTDPWLPRDILSPVHNITVDRETLGPGTLSVVLHDADLDPSRDALLQPGREIRLRSKIMPQDQAQGLLITATITKADVTYLGDPKIPAPKAARIEITATDALATLSQAGRADGVASVEALIWVLEGTGVPYVVNGDWDQDNALSHPNVVASSSEASTALDQVIITRDTTHGGAWITRDGTLCVWSRFYLPTAPVPAGDVINEDIYTSDPEISYSTEDCINEVKVVIRRPNLATGETVEVTYGPYVDAASVAERGRYASTVTVHGIPDTEAAAYAHARTILDLNAAPARRVASVRYPIKDLTAFTSAGGRQVTRDLGDVVRVTNTRADIDQALRINRVRHDITPNKWMMTLGFSEPSAVAIPLTVAPVRNNPVTLPGWQPLPLASGWAASSAAEYQVLGGACYLRGSCTRTSGTSTTVASLPTGARPVDRTHNALVRISTSTLVHTLAVSTSGAVVVGGTYTTGNTINLESITPFLV